VAARISRSVMNNSVSSTVLIGLSKTKWIVSKLAGLTLVGVSMLHCSEVDWVRECVAGYVTGWDGSYRAFMSLTFCSSVNMCHVGKRLECRELPNNSFLFLYCMVSIIPGFPLQCRIRVFCLVCVMHALKSGY
jgi:hypothetical protein